ncbi:MAG: hypothetical protein ACRCV6_10335, partial [Formosimonas sp.]
MELINEPLIKIVPKGGRSPDYSPYWTTESEFNAASADGKNLSKHFGLPISSESAEYDIYKIVPKQPTEVFISQVARTTELKGADTVFKHGGARQYLTPNRQLFEPAEHIGLVQNRLYIPHQKELQIPSDLKNPAIQTIGGIPRSELAAMNDELLKRGYNPSQSLEAVHARVTVQTALNDHLTGKTPNTDLTHSQQVLQQTASVLKDTPHQYNINQQITATHQMHNGASNDIIQHTLTAKPAPLQPPSPFHQAHTNPAPEVKLNNPPVEYGPPNGFSSHNRWEAEQRAAQLELSRTINQSVIEAEAASNQKFALHQQRMSEVRTQLAMEGAGKVLGKTIAAVGIIDAGVSIYDDTKAAARTANTNQQEWQKGGGALLNSTMQQTGIDLAISGGDALLNLAVKGVNPSHKVLDSVQHNAQKREAFYTELGQRMGDAFQPYLSEEGRSETRLKALNQQIEQTPDPIRQQEIQSVINQEEKRLSQVRFDNLKRLEAVQIHDATYPQFAQANPKLDISSDTIDQHLAQSLKSGFTGETAVHNARLAAIEAQKAIDAQSLAKLSETDRAAALKIYQDNPGATVDTSIAMVELIANRGMTSMGGAPHGESQLKAAQANMEEANRKADPTYGKDARDIALQRQAQQAQAAEKAQQQLFKAIEKLDLDSKITYFKARAA